MMSLAAITPQVAQKLQNTLAAERRPAPAAMLTLAPVSVANDQETPVYSRPTAPKSIGGVLDDAVNLYRECLPRSWPLALAAQVALALTDIHLQSQLPPHALADPQVLFALLRSGDFLLSALFSCLLLLLFNYALIDHMHAIATHRPASLGRSIGVGVRLLPRAILASILVAVATGVGFLLLLVPGIYLAGAWLLTFAAMVIGDAGVVESMRISQRLIQGHWWRSTTLYSVAALIALAFFAIVGLLLGLSAPPSPAAGAIVIGLQRLASVAVGSLMMLWFPTVLLSLYYDLDLRRTGADLAQRVAQLPGR